MGLEGATPVEKIFYDLTLAFKTTPTPSEMAFDPLPQILSFLTTPLQPHPEKKNYDPPP